MEHEEIKKQTRIILNELIEYPFSQIFDISPAEQKLKELYQISPTALEPLIGLMLANIMLGKRDVAEGLADKIWSIGGNLSPFFELIYTDNLLNIGEIERAGILLKARLANISDNIKHFYTVMIKYALLSGNLALVKQIGGYPDVYDKEPILFDFADRHCRDLSIKDYRAILKILRDNLDRNICAFEYLMYSEGSLEFVLYTSDDIEQNETSKKILTEKINGYFMTMQQPLMDDLTIDLKNIKLHPSWIGKKD